MRLGKYDDSLTQPLNANTTSAGFTRQRYIRLRPFLINKLGADMKHKQQANLFCLH